MYSYIYFRDHPLFSVFCKSTESTLGEGVKMLVLATVPVHETSLVNQHFYSTLLGRREGVCKKSTFCTLVKMLKITDGPLTITVLKAPLQVYMKNTA